MVKLKNAHVHRFGDNVAISLPGEGETVYITAAEATKLAKVLNACARDIKACKFSASPFVSTEINLSRYQ
jgi:hypothetical protein